MISMLEFEEGLAFVSGETKLQVLRTIDKFDKIGRDGVVELLQKPVAEFGAALDPVRAGLIGLFMDVDGSSSEQTVDKIGRFFGHAKKVGTRLDLMGVLEGAADDSGRTAWDRLLDMPQNEDETWKDGGRPANIGWALDDILELVVQRGKDFTPPPEAPMPPITACVAGQSC